ncbi:hypothetical protein ACR75N_04925 [Parabacteroides merdae]|uniref:hypothetical protein n=1 Tax=Parabacteroides merdae TaxID=46503 RepID=UPI003DA218B9
MVNLEAVKHWVMCVIDENGKMIRIATLHNILSNSGLRVSNSELDLAIDDLLKSGFIEQRGNMYYRK